MSEKGALKNKKIEVIALVILAAFIVAWIPCIQV